MHRIGSPFTDAFGGSLNRCFIIHKQPWIAYSIGCNQVMRDTLMDIHVGLVNFLLWASVFTCAVLNTCKIQMLVLGSNTRAHRIDRNSFWLLSNFAGMKCHSLFVYTGINQCLSCVVDPSMSNLPCSVSDIKCVKEIWVCWSIFIILLKSLFGCRVLLVIDNQEGPDQQRDYLMSSLIGHAQTLCGFFTMKSLIFIIQCHQWPAII